MANWFKEFEDRKIFAKDEVPWPITIEYEIQSEYFISNLSSLPGLDSASDTELLKTAQHLNNLIGWVEQMRVMGYSGLPPVIESLLEEKFGDRQKLVHLRHDYLQEWMKGKTGQHKIGENHFTLREGKFYYANLNQEWFLVSAESVFEVMPTLLEKADPLICDELDSSHKSTRYQQIHAAWRDADYRGKPLSELFPVKNGETTPEDVLTDTLKKLKNIAKDPISLVEIERLVDEGPNTLEYLIKISCLIADYAQLRRESNELSLYLLRDCAMFHEAQIFIDMVEGVDTAHGQVYLGRQSFSSKRRDAGHWFACQELLLLALKKHPKDFTAFYEEFAKSLREYEAYSSEFAELVHNLTLYINNHIELAKRNRLAINVVDLGFQGSINMIVKYVLDNYCLTDAKLPTSIEMYVVAEWFKGVYESMYVSDTFSALTHIEVLSRNNEIYQYKPWSLREGELSVVYGSKECQSQADVELTVLAMCIMIEKSL